MTHKTILLSFIAYPWPVHNQFDIALASSFLSKYKSNPIFAICNQTLNMKEASEVMFGQDFLDNEAIRKYSEGCTNNNEKFIRNFFPTARIFNSRDHVDERQVITRSKRLYSEIIRNFSILSSNSLLPIKQLELLSPIFTRFRVSSIKELLSVEDALYLHKLLESYCYTFTYGECFAENLIELLGYEDKIVCSLYNGRFCIYSGFYSSISRYAYNTLVHERGHLSGSFRISINCKPMDILSFDNSIRHNASSLILDESMSDEIESFMLRRRKGGQQNTNDFKGVDSFVFPENVDFSNSVALFTSSLDESTFFLPTEDYINATREISKYASALQKQGYSLIVRHHPNLGKIGCPVEATDYLAQVNQLTNNHPNLIIIPPQADIHWSLLTDRVPLSIVPHSSLALDFRYWQIPVVSPGLNSFPSITDSADLLFKERLSVLDTLQLLNQNHIEHRARKMKPYLYCYYLASSFTTELVSIVNIDHPQINALPHKGLKLNLESDNLMILVDYLSNKSHSSHLYLKGLSPVF